MSGTGRASVGYGEVLAAIEAAFETGCDLHGAFIACTNRSERAAVAVLDALRSLPVEERMDAMGMRPSLGHQIHNPTKFLPCWTEAPDAVGGRERPL